MTLRTDGVDCIGYTRVSTEAQAGEDRTSLADQRAAIERLAASLGRTVQAWYEDAGASGGTAEGRPRFMAMVRYCQANPRSLRSPGYVLVLNDSRFGRFTDPEEATMWRVLLKKETSWLVRFVESDEITDRTGRAIMRLIGSAQATEYRENVRRNARRGAKGTAEAGYWGSRTPFGYRRMVVHPAGRERILAHGARKAPDERVVLVPEAEEASIVRQVFQRYASGQHTLDSLTEWLLTTAPSRRWTRPAVRYLLSNPAYVGDVVFGRTPADAEERAQTRTRPESEWFGRRGAHEALVSRSLFNTVQSRLAINRRAGKGVRRDWILSGIVRCRCGAPFASGGGGGRRSAVLAYRCVTRGLHPSARCAFPGAVTKDHLESAVIRELVAVIGSRRTQEVVRRRLAAAIERVKLAPNDRAEVVAKELAQLTAQRDRLVGAVADGTLASEEARPRLELLRDRMRRAESALEEAQGEGGALRALEAVRAQVEAASRDFRKAAEQLRGPALREHIRPWIAGAVFDTSTRVLRLEICHAPGSAGMEPKNKARRSTCPSHSACSSPRGSSSRSA